MSECENDYAAYYRWEWFRRKEWIPSFRERKGHSSGAFINLIKERSLLNQPVLDCSCGLGLKTIIMREAGLNIYGSDQCALAIDYARLLAKEEGNDSIPYFVSSWENLPRKSFQRYAAIFNDALSWVYSDDEMANSLKGIHDSLQPGGFLCYMGALPGTDTDQKKLLEQEWDKKTSNSRHWIGLNVKDENISMQEVVFLEKGADYIDEHHLYISNSKGKPQVDSWCLRCAIKWSWPRILPFLEGAGFLLFEKKEFVAANGKPFHLVVAFRD